MATSDGEYTLFGRVFTDPMGGCQNMGESPCSPNAQGNSPATQFIGQQELLDGLEYMNQNAAWQHYMEVWPLDTGEFPGNNLEFKEFDPKAEFESAGLPTSTLDRAKSKLIVVRVTDESVPDAGKKRMALSLSIHGIERAGAEGGTRALEDLVTAGTTGNADKPILPEDVSPGAPSFEDVLKNTIIYFTYPNPDGWRRGSVSQGGVFFQRYNGNGVDPNRDWADVGYSFRGYSGYSEPETQAFKAFYEDVMGKTGAQFAAGDDLHGQPFADALSFTMMPHGRHDWGKNGRLVEAAKSIHAVSEKALAWSPLIQPNDAPQGGDIGCFDTVAAGDACAQIYGQTWGTVYDTINYTTTGTLGDWFDSDSGLGADGIDNEMSFSHIDKNIVFDPHTEQLHVDGNKALIYAHLAEVLDPPSVPFDARGTKGYVPNKRLTRAEQDNQPSYTADPQAPIEMGPKPQEDTYTVYDKADGFELDPTAGNGGMRVDVTLANVDGVFPSYVPAASTTSMKVECRGCDDHHGDIDTRDGDWVVVAEDFNQKQLYQAAGLTASVNRPQMINADKTPTLWRVVIDGPHGATKVKVTFTRGPASVDGDHGAGGAEAPHVTAYDVANTDFFADLERFDAQDPDGYSQIDPHKVISGEQSLAGLDTLALADDALPGYTGDYGSGVAPPPDDGFDFENQGNTVPGARDSNVEDLFGPVGRIPGSYETVEWDVSPDAGNKTMSVDVRWADKDNDWDMYLYRLDENGDEVLVNKSTSVGGTTDTEHIAVGDPAPGHYKLYVDNYTSTDPVYTGAVAFEGFPPPTEGGDTGAFTKAEKDAWVAKLDEFVRGGGNLVLTDGAIRALADLTDIPARAIAQQTVYVGQSTFSDGDNTTLEHELAAGVEQPGARFNNGMRRQTYESTPLGFAIQNSRSGGDESHAVQYDVRKASFEAAGGSVAATSADSGTRDAAPVYDRVTVGEIPLGNGRIRIAGALLPQPSQAYDHPLGVEPYALTYTGYAIARNLLDWSRPRSDTSPPPPPPVGPPPPVAPPPPPPADTTSGGDTGAGGSGGSTGSSGGSGGVAGDGSAPARIAIAGGRLVISRTGVGRVKLSCSQAPCEGRLVVKVAGRTIGMGAYDLAKGRSAKVAFKLNRRGRALLRSSRALRASLTAVAGGRTIGRRTVRLQRR